MEATYLRDECLDRSQHFAMKNIEQRKQNENDLIDMKTQIHREKIPASLLEKMEGESQRLMLYIGHIYKIKSSWRHRTINAHKQLQQCGDWQGFSALTTLPFKCAMISRKGVDASDAVKALKTLAVMKRKKKSIKEKAYGVEAESGPKLRRIAYK